MVVCLADIAWGLIEPVLVLGFAWGAAPGVVLACAVVLAAEPPDGVDDPELEFAAVSIGSALSVCAGATLVGRAGSGVGLTVLALSSFDALTAVLLRLGLSATKLNEKTRVIIRGIPISKRCELFA